MSSPHDRHIRNAMIDAMVEADFGEGSPRARAALGARIAASPAAAEAHDRLAALWEDLGALEPPALSASASAALAAGPPDRRWWQDLLPEGGWRIAAAILPVLLLLGALLQGSGLWTGATSEEIRTAANERRIVTLSDGSTVSLSPGSVLAVTMARAERRLTLRQGEGLFDVAHDPARPFLVAAGNGTVRAVGTAFNIRVGDEVVVTVVEGTVSIDAGKARATRVDRPLTQLATAGQQVRFGVRTSNAATSRTQDFITPPRPVDAERYTSWTSGVLRFDGEPLRVVIGELNRYSGREIVLTDPALANTPIYGVFHVGDVEGLRSIVRDLERPDGVSAEETLVVDRSP